VVSAAWTLADHRVLASAAASRPADTREERSSNMMVSFKGMKGRDWRQCVKPRLNGT
jgi:hypothetical protein